MSQRLYPEVEALKAALREHRLRLVVEAAPPPEHALGYRRVRLERPRAQPLGIWVDDEDRDAVNDNQPLLLNLVLMACEAYEEAHDPNAWAMDTGLDIGSAEIRELYDELVTVVPRIRAVLGEEVRAVSAWDFALDAGAAQALRRGRG